MTFVIPALDDTHAILLADYQNRFPDADISRFSDNWKRLRTLALGITSLHAHLDDVYESLLPDGATGARLDRLGAIWGVTRKPATSASGVGVLRVTGTPAATVSIGDRLTHKDGTGYQINSSGTVASTGHVDVDVLAIDTGSITRKSKGEVFNFVSSPSGINGSAELQADMNVGGEDTETDGAYRARILDRIAEPGMGGNANDYRSWALSQEGAAEAYVYPLRQGLGSVDVAFLHTGRGAERLPSSPEIAAMQTYINTVRPVSVADFRVLTVIGEPQDVEVMILPVDKPAYQFDWDDGVPPTVSAFNSSTRVLTFSPARPTDIFVNDRIVYKSTATPNDGAELVVEAMGPGSDDVTVKALTPAQLAAPPTAGDKLYSGGPLVEPLRQAILELFDELGPARGVDAAKVAGVWMDKLRVARIIKVVESADGVDETTVLAPAANVAGTNIPPNSTVGLIIPRQVIIRRGGVE